eukprot:1190539-Prorocentrum_minimum.AAC.1
MGSRGGLEGIYRSSLDARKPQGSRGGLDGVYLRGCGQDVADEDVAVGALLGDADAVHRWMHAALPADHRHLVVEPRLVARLGHRRLRHRVPHLGAHERAPKELLEGELVLPLHGVALRRTYETRSEPYIRDDVI